MKTMVIIAHPHLNTSRVNKAFKQELEQHADIDVRDLYQEYPNWEIDVAREQRQLLQYDRIVFQFPFYWYSCPSLLKKWFDDVLTFGWAFGPGGEQLKGKEFMIVTSVGGTESSYRSGGENWYTISELLRPIQSTLTKCNGIYLPAFATYNADACTADDIVQEARKYVEHIQATKRVLAH